MDFNNKVKETDIDTLFHNDSENNENDINSDVKKEEIKEVEKKEEIKIEEKKEEIKEVEKKDEIKIEEKKEEIKTEEKKEEIKKEEKKIEEKKEEKKIEEKKEENKVEEKKDEIKNHNTKHQKVSMFDILNHEPSMPSIEKNDYEKCINSFNDIFLTNINNTTQLKNIISDFCINNKIEENIIRSTIWKIMIENIIKTEKISLENIIIKTKEKRKEFHKKLETYNKLKKLPLTSIEWINYITEIDNIKVINLDIDRTFPSSKIFSNKKIKNIESSILTIWSSENKDLGYHQGMNEILAMIIHSFYPFYFKNPNKHFFDNFNNEILKEPNKIKKELYNFFHDEDEFESDIYNYFSILMSKGIKKLYNEIDISKNQNIEVQEYLLQRCSNIINKKIRLQNENLFKHFKEISIDCEIILQRWLKCLFDREFDYKFVLGIWDIMIYDTLICEKVDFELADYICVAMIDYLKNDLIKCDQAETLELLFNYPKINSPIILISNALNFRNDLIDKEKEDDKKQEEMKIKKLNLMKQIEDIDKTTSKNRIEMKKKISLSDILNDPKNSLQQILKNIKNTNSKTNNKNDNNNNQIKNKQSTKMFANTQLKNNYYIPVKSALLPENYEEEIDENQLYQQSLDSKEKKLKELKTIFEKYKNTMDSEDFKKGNEILEFLRKNL